jgi:hypothetical protein
MNIYHFDTDNSDCFSSHVRQKFFEEIESDWLNIQYFIKLFLPPGTMIECEMSENDANFAFMQGFE